MHDKTNYSFENARLYTIVYHSSKRIFLALPDTKDLTSYSYNAASDWPCTFFTARVFLFSISLLFVSMMLVISKP